MGPCIVAMGLSTVAAVTSANAATIRTGNITSQPMGHHQYCARGGRHCGGHADAGPAKLTQKRLAALRSVNSRVNGAIRPATDQQIHGRVEYWTNGGAAGDCEDYALKKRSLLLSRGFHPSQLPLAKVRQRNGEAHIVLVVRTSEGDLVLDNLTDSIKPYRKTGHRFLKMQSGTNSSQWVRIRR